MTRSTCPRNCAWLLLLLLHGAANLCFADHAESYIQIAARQSLLDSAAEHGLLILKDMLGSLSIDTIEKSIPIPALGDVQLTLSELNVEEFQMSESDARLVIMDGYFHLKVQRVMMKLDFKWHWEKGAIHGSGEGDLQLEGGAIDFVFKVESSPQTHLPEILVLSDGGIFDQVELNVRSATTDWLYQAVMRVFRDVISDVLQNAISKALTNDVPEAVNKVLASLPTTIDIEGTPISFRFDYSVYTLRYVLIKGAAQLVTDALQWANPQCPYPSSHLPLPPGVIAVDPYMLSVYAHENMVNCLFMGFFNSGLLKASIVDGTIPKLQLTTDLLGSLIPELPKKYPKQKIKVDVEALAHPSVAFNASQGASLDAQYRLAVYVDDPEQGTPHIATLRASLAITAQVTWDSTVIPAVSVKHELEPGATLDVPVRQWDMTVGWFIQNYAGLFPLSQIIGMIQAPTASLVNLVNAEVKVLDHWFAVSGDVTILGKV